MAITWTCEISNVDPSEFRADLSFKREDDVTGAMFSIHYQKTLIETAAQRTALLDTVWSEWEKEQAKLTAIGNFITNLEQLAKSNLETMEV